MEENFLFLFLFAKIENNEQICKYPKVLYCNCIYEVGEKHMLEWKLEVKEVKISISCFLCVLYIQVITPFAT